MKSLAAVVVLSILPISNAYAASTWSGGIKCSYGSGSLSLSVDDAGNITGGVTNGKVRSGRVSGSSVSFATSNFMGNKATFTGSVSGGSMSGTYTQSANGETCTWFASKTGGGAAQKTAKAAAPDEPGINSTPISNKFLPRYTRIMGEVRSIVEEALPVLVGRELDYYEEWLDAHNALKKSQKKIVALNRTLAQQMREARQRQATATYKKLTAEVATYKKLHAERDAIVRK